jgi:drug/metabolite transporter (DMT)-like permease
MSPNDPNPERRGILLMLVSILFFAVNVLILRAVALAAPSADGWVASSYRGIVGGVLVWLVYRGRGFEPRNLLRQPWVLARGLVGSVGIVTFYLTIEHLGAGRAVILNMTYPLFGAVIAAVWLGEPLRWGQFGWMLVAFGGLSVFFGEAVFAGRFSRHEVIGLVGAVVAGVAVVIIRLLRNREHASTVFASQCLWSWAVSIPMAMGKVAGLPWKAHFGLAAASAVVAVAQITMTHGFHLLPVARGSSIQMLLPLVTAIGGIVCFDEHLSGTEWLGGAVLLGATWLAVRPAPTASAAMPRDSR